MTTSAQLKLHGWYHPSMMSIITNWYNWIDPVSGNTYSEEDAIEILQQRIKSVPSLTEKQTELLGALKEAWAANPELRLCQLIQNASMAYNWRDLDLFFYRDDDLIQALKEYVK